jgi:hypothetical protein
MTESLFLSDAQGLSVLWLHGSGVQPPLVGAVRASPRRLDADTVEETLTIALEGSGITAWLETLEARLADGRDGITPCYLHLQTAPGAPIWRSPLRGGELTLLEGDPTSRGVRLTLRRPPWWEGSLQALPLSNPNGSRLTGGLTLSNHQDDHTGHVNYAGLAAADLPGSLPAPFQAVLRAVGAGESLHTVLLGLGTDLEDADGALRHALEGEAAQAGAHAALSVITAGTASGGACARLTWSTPFWAHLATWTLPAADLGYLRGRRVHPVLVLATPPASAGLTLAWRVTAAPGAAPLAQSALFPAQVGHGLQVGPALHLPPLALGGGPYPALYLELWAESTPALPGTLDVDAVHLLPAEGWLCAYPLGGTPAGWDLVLDGLEGRVYSREPATGARALTHVVGGEWPHLRPPHAHRLYLLWETQAGAAPPAQVTLRLFLRPRCEGVG